MDFPAPLTPPSNTSWRSLGGGFALLALVLYGAFLARNVSAVAAGSDSSGYLNHARLLASGTVHAQPRPLAGLPPSAAPKYLYMPLGFVPAPNGVGMVPTYPAGLGLFVLAAAPLAGWTHAADAVLVLHSLAGLVLTFALGRRLGLGRRWAFFGAAIVAASPVYVFMSLQAMSDVPALVWTTIAVLAAIRSREKPIWALAAGAAAAIDVLLRPTNLLAFVPVAMALGARGRPWVLFILGGLPGAIFLGAHSMAAYGSLLTTGYGDNSYSFSGAYVLPTLVHYALWLPALLTPVAALALGLPWTRTSAPSAKWLLGAWIVSFGAFYSFYECTHETWWYMRFLLPAAPALVVAGLIVMRQLCSSIARRAGQALSLTLLVAGLTLVGLNSYVLNRNLFVLPTIGDEKRYGATADWMRSNLPQNAVCLAMQETGALYYYTGFTFIRWDALTKENVAKIEPLIRTSGRPLYAVLFPYEVTKEDVLGSVMPGHWTQVATVADVTVWRRSF